MGGSVHIAIRVTKAGKRYIVRYRRGGRGYPVVHGGSYRRLQHARERQRLIGGWLAAGVDPQVELAKLTTQPEVTTLTQTGHAWFASRIDLSHQSRRVYAAYLAAIAACPLGQVPPSSVTPEHVRAQIEHWTVTGLAAKSVRERISVLRQVLDFADITPNPARHHTIKLPPTPDVEPVLPSADHIITLTHLLPSRYRLPFVLLEQTGMRVSEVFSLDGDDIDAAGARIRIKASNRKGRRGRRRPRLVPVPGWLMDHIATVLPATERVFADATPDGLRATLSTLCAHHNLPHITPHQLRHRRISLWHLQGTPARELADRAGHTRPSISLDIYSHAIQLQEADPDILQPLLQPDQDLANKDAWGSLDIEPPELYRSSPNR
jgi:integrase